uniref:Uncharacterized protein n=1 Tax=Psilocybe cubensis TaxID=181762 RepID=A0A8H8CGD0_PSICU
MSTQLIGFSIGGIGRRFLVDPPSMKFSDVQRTIRLPTGIPLPGLEAFYSVFSWACWIAPQNIVVNQMFGYFHGMGMSLITFDWAQIAYIGSPLATPWWAEANIVLGFILFYWIGTPVIYYTNTWYTQYLPISTRGSYDNTGKSYNVTRIIDSRNNLDVEAYKAYSPIFLSATFATSYGLSFAAITATLTHAFLFYGKQIWTQARRSLHEQPDIHARLMSRYEQVPEWYYAVIFVSMFIFSIISIEALETDLPVWGFILALSISFMYVIPCGMIQAVTNQQVGLNVIAELVVGYALPGRPVAMMLFKTWGYITMAQALTFSSDFKLGHYMKIPPKSMFFAQVVCAVISGTVQLAVQSWMFSNIEDICDPLQKSGFVCPNTEVFGTASIIWGVIGPARQFSKGQIYYVLLSGTGAIPPANAVNYITWGIVGFIFQFLVRRRHFSWWTKYNYVLSAALDAGVAIGAILVFFCLQYPLNGSIGNNTIQKWWGNTVFYGTADYLGTPLKALKDDGSRFGPSSW